MMRSVGLQVRNVGVRPRRRSATRTLPVELLGVVYFLMLLSAGVLLVSQPARVTEATHKINRLEATLNDLKLRNEDLKKTVSAMESLGYIESQARERLGMVDPGEVRICEVKNASNDNLTVASATHEPQQTGIISVLARIAQIFGSKQATAKGQK